MIYLNNAEATLDKACGAVKQSFAAEEEVKVLAAGLFAVKYPENIFLTKGGAYAMETALRAFAGEGGHIIASGLEKEDTYRFLQELESRGTEVTYMESDSYQRPKYDELEGMIRPDTKAILCAHGCSATGNVTDLAKVCAIAHSRDIPVISDGRHTAGAVDVRLEDLGVDVYIFTGENMLMGPAGIGGICLWGGAGRTALENTLTPPEPEVLGAFAAALKFILDKGIYGITMPPHRLAKRFFESAKGMDHVRVHGDFGAEDRLPIVSITAKGFTAEGIQEYMAKRGVIIGAEKGLARFSFGFFNTRLQVKDTVWALMDMLGIDDLYLLP